MMKSTVIEKLCQMPLACRERGDVSMADLLAESGYTDCPDDITEGDLEKHIREHPDLIQLWLVESEDQRCTPAWYLKAPAEGSPARGWVVGFYPGGSASSGTPFRPVRSSSNASSNGFASTVERPVNQALVCPEAVNG